MDVANSKRTNLPGPFHLGWLPMIVLTTRARLIRFSVVPRRLLWQARSHPLPGVFLRLSITFLHLWLGWAVATVVVLKICLWLSESCSSQPNDCFGLLCWYFPMSFFTFPLPLICGPKDGYLLGPMPIFYCDAFAFPKLYLFLCLNFYSILTAYR